MQDKPNAVKEFANYIDGNDRPSSSGETFETFNPTTGSLWAKFAIAGKDDVDLAVRSAHTAFEDGAWSKMSPTQRGRLLMAWGEKIAQHSNELARLETIQNGKLFSELVSQVRASSEWLYYFGGLADKIEGSVIPLNRQHVLNYVVKEPLGVIAIIVPWNSPTFVTIMASSPALAAGNTVVIKPSEVTPASALELARLAIEAGIPAGVVNVVTGLRDTGEDLVNHELVRKINFTGGDAGGRAIAAKAGSRLVECVLELGGKSPNIVFEDADLDRAEAGVLSGIFGAAGQTCVAGSRAYIHKNIYSQFIERLINSTSRIVIGDPMAPETQMGPIATKNQLQKDESMVRVAVGEGAKILHGGTKIRVEGLEQGYFFAPTILGEAKQHHTITQTEVFGPVLSVVPFETDEEVVNLANDSRFGLAAGVWTDRLDRAHNMARSLKAGTVWINTYRALAFNSPFGGYKASGIGRQNGIGAVNQYLQPKSIWCDIGSAIESPFILKA